MKPSANSNRRLSERFQMPQPMFEPLEQRMLLSIDWSGAWSFSGFQDELNGPPLWQTVSKISAGVTIAEQPGGDFLMTVHKYGTEYTLQALGDDLQGTSSGTEDEAYHEDVIRVVPISDNAAVFLLGQGWFTDSGKMEMMESTGVVGVLTRGKVSAAPRPWAGDYALHGYDVEAQGPEGSSPGSVSASTHDAQVHVADIGGGQYTVQEAGNPEVWTFTASGNTLVKTVDDINSQSHTWIYRGPGDTLYVLDEWVDFGADRTQVLDGYHSGGVVTPLAGSEYKPDLTIEVVGSAIGNFIPGEKVSIPVRISNIGNAPARGKVQIDYLAWGNGVGVQGASLVKVNLAPGASKIVTYKIVVPADAPPAAWTVQAEVTPITVAAELDPDNNTTQTDDFLDVVWSFGAIDGKMGHKLTLTDSDGTRVTFAMSGPGGGVVSMIDSDWSVAMEGNTTKASGVSIKTKSSGAAGDDGKATLGAFTAAAPLKWIKGKTTDLTGAITLSAADPTTVSFTFDRIADGTIVSGMPVASLSANEWTDGADSGTYTPDLTAPAISKITVKGDFEADLAVTGGVGKVSIRGNAVGSLWDVGGTITNLAVTGPVEDCIVRAGGDMLKVTLGAATGSDFGAGVTLDLLRTQRHAGAGDVATGTIKSFTVKGSKATPAEMFFADSNLSAATISAATLVNVKFNNDQLGLDETQDDFGLWAPAIGKLKVSDWTDRKNKAKNWTWKPTMPLPTGLDDFNIR